MSKRSVRIFDISTGEQSGDGLTIITIDLRYKDPSYRLSGYVLEVSEEKHRAHADGVVLVIKSFGIGTKGPDQDRVLAPCGKRFNPKTLDKLVQAVRTPGTPENKTAHAAFLTYLAESRRAIPGNHPFGDA